MPDHAETHSAVIDGSRTMSGNPSGFRSLIGYRTTVWQDGYAEVELEIASQHMNSLGILHGGVYMTLHDAAFGHATTWCSVPGNVRTCVTMSLNTSFVASVKSGIVTSIGRLHGIEGRVTTATGEVRDGAGRLLSVAQASFLYFSGSERVEGVTKGR